VFTLLCKSGFSLSRQKQQQNPRQRGTSSVYFNSSPSFSQYPFPHPFSHFSHFPDFTPSFSPCFFLDFHLLPASASIPVFGQVAQYFLPLAQQPRKNPLFATVSRFVILPFFHFRRSAENSTAQFSFFARDFAPSFSVPPFSFSHFSF